MTFLTLMIATKEALLTLQHISSPQLVNQKRGHSPIFQLNHSPNTSRTQNYFGNGASLHCSPHVQKPNWMKDNLTLIKHIHTKSIQLQSILSNGHEWNRCWKCSNSMEQKKHIPLAIFLVFNASFNDKTLTITLQMNIVVENTNNQVMGFLPYAYVCKSTFDKCHLLIS